MRFSFHFIFLLAKVNSSFRWWNLQSLFAGIENLPHINIYSTVRNVVRIRFPLRLIDNEFPNIFGMWITIIAGADCETSSLWHTLVVRIIDFIIRLITCTARFCILNGLIQPADIGFHYFRHCMIAETTLFRHHSNVTAFQKYCHRFLVPRRSANQKYRRLTETKNWIMSNYVKRVPNCLSHKKK